MTIREKIYNVIFETNTAAGRNFDLALVWVIIISVLSVCLESVQSIDQKYGEVLNNVEWFVTIVFTVEIVLRLYSSKKPAKYIFSFYGLVDILSTIPSYISLYFSGAQALMVIRSIRLLRVFKLLRLNRFVGEANVLTKALMASRHKIAVFLMTVLTIALLAGAVMYLIEGEKSGFTSIPNSMYWAIVTMTTVGYGDIAPVTDLGKALAAVLMVMGYGIIAVPTGIVSTEIARAAVDDTNVCSSCKKGNHRDDAAFCWSCGEIIK